MKLRDDVIGLGNAVAGGLLWRVGERLNLTVIVKATFKVVADGRMTPLPPRPIHPTDILMASGDGVVAPSDLAPYLGKADIVVCAGPRESNEAARIVLRSETSTLLDKVGPVAELGAIAATARQRRDRLPEAVRRALDEDLPELPLDVDWAYFQAAPADQQLPFLAGDEWLLLRDLTPAGLLRSQLPGAAAATWVWPRGGDFDEGYPVTTYADRLLVDAHTEAVTITWRGVVPLKSEDVLSALTVAAGVYFPGSPIDWSTAIGEAQAQGRSALSVTHEGELSVAPPVPRRAAAQSAAVEDDAVEDDAVEDDALEGTIGIAQAIHPRAATPFPLQQPTATRAKRSPPTPLPGAPWSAAEPRAVRTPLAAQATAGTLEVPVIADDRGEDPLEGTIGISGVVAPQAASPFPLVSPGRRPALSPVPLPGAPWSGIPSAPVVRVESLADPLEGTLGLQGAAAQLHGAATPLAPPGSQMPMSAPRSPWAGGSAAPTAGPAAMHAQAGHPPAPPRADNGPAPAPPARIVPAAAPAEQSSAREGIAPSLDVPTAAEAPAPAEDASPGEAFLGALEWLEEHTKD